MSQNIDWQHLCNLASQHRDELEATIAALQSEIARMLAAVVARKSIYLQKQSKEDIAAPDTLTRWEALQHTIEALEHLEAALSAPDVTRREE